MIESYLAIPPLLGFVGLLVALGLYIIVNRFPEGDENVKKIGDQIHLGAMTFMKTEYLYLTIFALVVIVLVWMSLGHDTAIAVLAGALSSSIAGWIGMYSATKANVRTATAASESGAETALSVAFYGGSIMGLCVASLGLIGLGSLYYLLTLKSGAAHSIEGFAMGASIVALFSRVGGGIFTKSADVGADLVGKLEAGIPEDDPRNPGVIADNVGDNVGDIAGMGSDIFESYCGSMVACIAIASTSVVIAEAHREGMMFLPLALASIGLISSIIGIIVVRIFSNLSPALAMRIGTIAAPIIFVSAAYFLINFLVPASNIWLAVVCGSAGGMVIGLITEYYTGSKPIVKIAESGQTGPATVMITGLAVGMQSVVVPIACIALIIFCLLYTSPSPRD